MFMLTQVITNGESKNRTRDDESVIESTDDEDSEKDKIDKSDVVVVYAEQPSKHHTKLLKCDMCDFRSSVEGLKRHKV